MGAIVDTLYLGEEEIASVKRMYPGCKVINQSHSEYTIQKYRVIIPTEDSCLDSYYIFLIENRIAMSSRNFVGRIASDTRFVNRMRTKVAEYDDKMKGAVGSGKDAPESLSQLLPE